MENRERKEVEKAAWFNHPFQTEGKKGTDIFSVLHLIIIRVYCKNEKKNCTFIYYLLLFSIVLHGPVEVYTPARILFLFPVGSIEKVVCEYTRPFLLPNLIGCFQWFAIFKCPLRLLLHLWGLYYIEY